MTKGIAKAFHFWKSFVKFSKDVDYYTDVNQLLSHSIEESRNENYKIDMLLRKESEKNFLLEAKFNTLKADLSKKENEVAKLTESLYLKEKVEKDLLYQLQSEKEKSFIHTAKYNNLITKTEKEIEEYNNKLRKLEEELIAAREEFESKEDEQRLMHLRYRNFPFSFASILFYKVFL